MYLHVVLKKSGRWIFENDPPKLNPDGQIDPLFYKNHKALFGIIIFVK